MIMLFSLLVVICFFLSSIETSRSRIYSSNSVEKPLEIEKTRKHYVKRPLNPAYEAHKKMFKVDILNLLYRASETGELLKINHFSVFSSAIFEANSFYPYTPAEWAIHKRQNSIFRYYLEHALQDDKDLEFTTVREVGLSLAAMAIQSHNLSALKSLKQILKLDFRGNGLLSLAIQHLVNTETLDYLWNDFKLSDELYAEPPSKAALLLPFDACIKFNNIPALELILKQSPSLLFKAVEPIMALNRKRLFKNLIQNHPEVCSYSNAGGESLFHAAVISCPDPLMINLIADECPELDINAIDKNNFSPLTLTISHLIEFSERKSLAMFEALLSEGADLFNSWEKQRPIDLIIDFDNEEALAAVMQMLMSDAHLMGKIARLISKKGLWKILDKFILQYPGWIPFEWFDLRSLKISALASDDAYVTLHYLVESGYNFSRKEVVQVMGNEVSDEFRIIALKYLEEESFGI